MRSSCPDEGRGEGESGEVGPGDVPDDDVVVVRTTEGEFILSARDGMADAFRPDEGADLWPHHWGQEVRAMVSGHHVIDWLNMTACEFTARGFYGETESDGGFSAELHPEYNFVLSFSLDGAGPGEQPTRLEMTAHRVAPHDDILLSPIDVDPARVREHFE